MVSQCQALSLLTSVPCTEEATNAKGLFCRLHARQCMVLYVDYNRRNARLHHLDANPPVYLKTCPRALAANTFHDLSDEATVDEVCAHLFEVYNVLDKVIPARRLHHKYFYPGGLDHGHKAYIDHLVTRRQTTLRALEVLEKRRTLVLYEGEKRFSCVRLAQEDEESQREKEQKRVKLEADLWKRHWRELETRLHAIKEKQRLLAQEAFLDEAWKEQRLRQQEESAADGLDHDEGWGPIKDMVQEEDRNKFLDLLRHFLWLESPSASSGDAGAEAGPETRPTQAGPETRPTPISPKAWQSSKGPFSTPTSRTGATSSWSWARTRRGCCA